MKTHGNGIRHLLAHMLDAADRPKYDELCESGRLLDQSLPFYRTVHFEMKSPSSIIAPRDICTLARLTCEEDGSFLISLVSVDHPDAQVKPPYVRCKIKSGGYIVRPTQEPDEFQICFMLQADP